MKWLMRIRNNLKMMSKKIVPNSRKNIKLNLQTIPQVERKYWGENVTGVWVSRQVCVSKMCIIELVMTSLNRAVQLKSVLFLFDHLFHFDDHLCL